MGDVVEVMLRQVMTALLTNDRALVREVSRMDNVVDKLDEAIKLYVTKLTRGSLDEREGRRAMEIISFSINLEHVGDIIDKNLSELAAKKIKRKLQFSPEGADELAAFHKRILESLRIALGVFMSGDANEARKLIAGEDRAAQRRAGRRRAPPRAPARRPAGDDGDDLAASRRAARPEAHPLAHLLGRLSGAGGRRRDERRRRRRERPHHRRRGEPQADRAVGLAPTGSLSPFFFRMGRGLG